MFTATSFQYGHTKLRNPTILLAKSRPGTFGWSTVQIAEDIPENKYDFKPAPEARSVAQTLTHLALAPTLYHHIHSNKVTDMKTLNFPEMMKHITTEEAKPRKIEVSVK